jgi:nitroreductase
MPRIAEHPADPMFMNRWSPRAMSGEALTQAELSALFEAARWAPSAINSQPWRFIYALAGTPDFQTFYELLAEGNRLWCVRAGALLCVVAKTTFGNGIPMRTHAFDTGAAWMSLALQASRMSLVAHGMGGFDYDAARIKLNVPEDFAVMCMVALGKPGRLEDLPEKLQAREQPNDRMLAETFAFAGRMP